MSTDSIQWNFQNNDEIIHAVSHLDFHKKADLLVMESQEALLYENGKLICVFYPGLYNLIESNHVFPSVDILDGSKMIAFVNINAQLNISWKTNMKIIDRLFDLFAPIFAEGICTIKINDSVNFIGIFNGLTNCTAAELTDKIQTILRSNMAYYISTYMTTNYLSIVQKYKFMEDLSENLSMTFKQYLKDIGLDLVTFQLSEIDVDTSSEWGKDIKRFIWDHYHIIETYDRK